MPKRRLREDQFRAASRILQVSDQTLKIAHGVLVAGRTQQSFVQELGLTKGAISQAVGRIWMAHESVTSMALPKGYERITAILPHSQAVVVRKWEKEALSNLPK